MKVWTRLTPDEIREVADSVGVRVFADYGERGITRLGGSRREGYSRYSFRLSLGERRLYTSDKDRKGWVKYQRVSAGYMSAGRKVAAVCWHGYRDFMLALFERDPDARLLTVAADYRGKQDFLDKYPDTAYRNIGPPIAPVYMHHACTCHDPENPWLIDLSVTPQASSFVMKQENITACRFYIMVPEHYRPDGTCKCDDPIHQEMMISEWGYDPADFKGVTT